MAAGADELPRPGRPVARVRLGLAARQRGQHVHHRGPERRGRRGQGRAGIQHHHVPRVTAERPRGQVRLMLALAARGIEPASRLHLREDGRPPHTPHHRDQQRDHQDQPPAPVGGTPPPPEYRTTGGLYVIRRDAHGSHNVPFSPRQQYISGAQKDFRPAFGRYCDRRPQYGSMCVSSSALSSSSTPEKGIQASVPSVRIRPSIRPSGVRLISRRRRIVGPGVGAASMAHS